MFVTILSLYTFYVYFLRYPLVLSIENHCNVKQQQRMASILTEVLGDHLATNINPNIDTNLMPSPHMLKGKVLIKVCDTL